MSGGLATLLLLNKLDVAAEIGKGIMQAKVKELFISQYLGGEVDQDDTAGCMVAVYLTKLVPSPFSAQVLQAYAGHVEKEIDCALEYDFRLNRDLMLINDTEEEGLLFEIPDKSNVEADAKEALMKSWIEKEVALIKQVSG